MLDGIETMHMIKKGPPSCPEGEAGSAAPNLLSAATAPDRMDADAHSGSQTYFLG